MRMTSSKNVEFEFESCDQMMTGWMQMKGWKLKLVNLILGSSLPQKIDLNKGSRYLSLKYILQCITLFSPQNVSQIGSRYQFQ